MYPIITRFYFAFISQIICSIRVNKTKGGLKIEKLQCNCKRYSAHKQICRRVKCFRFISINAIEKRINPVTGKEEEMLVRRLYILFYLTLSNNADKNK